MEATFRPQFARIKGVSDRRRLPRVGKIRLGVKAISQRTQNEYPKETDYFVVPPEIAKVYGEKPKELEVMFPVEDPEVIFPQRYVWYGKSKGAKCMGDGEEAMRVNDDGEFEPYRCPCEKLDAGECQRRAHLMVLLPRVSVAGVYQIDLGSYHSIVDINSGIDYIRALVGRFAMVPCKLRREPTETHANGAKQTHYTLRLFIDANVDLLNALRENTQRILTGPQYALPAPEEVNPAMDEDAVVEVVDEEEERETEPEPEPKEEDKPEPTPDPETDAPDNREEERMQKPAPDDAIRQVAKLAAKCVIDGTEKGIKAKLPVLTIGQVNALLGELSVIRGRNPIEMSDWDDRVKKVIKEHPGEKEHSDQEDDIPF